MRKDSHPKSFTLIEVLTVVAIIGILATLGSYGYAVALVRSRDSQRITDLQFISNGLEQFYLDYRNYPIFQSNNNQDNLPQASWQLEANYSCQNPDKKFLASKYLAQIPQDPLSKFIIGSGCNSSASGQYLYFGLPKSTSQSGYYLLARMERGQNVNYNAGVGDFLSNSTNGYTNLPVFCGRVQFNANPTGCSQNYYVTSHRGN